MAKVNYIRECRAFTMLAAEERLSANEVVLWHALYELFNRKAGQNAVARSAGYRRYDSPMRAKYCRP